jgi:hypothetical protein
MSMDLRIRKRSICALTRIILIGIQFLFSGTRNSRQLVPIRLARLIVVNNESSEIIRSLNSAFDEFLDEEYAKRDFYPEPLRKNINEVNTWIYDLYNNGVYKVCWFQFKLTVVWLCFSTICL